MKTTGIVIFGIGLLMTVFTFFSYVTKEKVVDLGSLEINADKTHNVFWSPYLGIVVMVVGAGIFIYSAKAKA
jgi:hypothetical protein